MPSWTPERYTDALLFAAAAHGAIDQKVPGSDLPYIVHPANVTIEVIAALRHHPEVDGDLAVQCALLHDTLEDTQATYEAVRERFGAAVADGVAALSKNEVAAVGLEGEPTRKAAMMADSLVRIRQQPVEVWMVKLADRVVNLSEPPHYWDGAKRRRYRAEAGIILAALGDASPYLRARLAICIEAYEAWLDPA